MRRVKTFFIAGAGTDVGKTYVTAALARALLRTGRTVGVFKPVASGYDPARPEESDAGRLLGALGRPLTADNVAAICPLRFAAPLSPPAAARREGLTLSLESIAGLCEAEIRAAETDILLVEGVGGLMSPLTDDATGLDLMLRLKAPSVLVGGTYLGAISHLLTAAEVLKSRGLEIAAVVISESPPPAPDFEETIADIGRFLPGLPLYAAGRADDWRADALAGRLVGA
jgi:dethiobiotin synthetase